MKIGLGFLIGLCLLSLPQAGYAQREMPSRSYGFAGTLLDVSLYHSLTDGTATPAAGNTWKSTTALSDLKLGYIAENQMYFGLLFSARSDDQVSADTANGSSAGVGIGYFAYNKVNVRAYYKFNETSGDYKDGQGYQVDLGVSMNPFSSFFVGFMISLREVTYKTNATIVGFDSLVRRETYPLISLGYLYY